MGRRRGESYMSAPPRSFGTTRVEALDRPRAAHRVPKEVGPAEFETFVGAQTIGTVDLLPPSGPDPDARRTPEECVLDALAISAMAYEGYESNNACGLGTVEGLLGLVLFGTPEELAAIRDAAGVTPSTPVVAPAGAFDGWTDIASTVRIAPPIFGAFEEAIAKLDDGLAICAEEDGVNKCIGFVGELRTALVWARGGKQ